MWIDTTSMKQDALKKKERTTKPFKYDLKFKKHGKCGR